jgi:hypothetical protein
MVVKESNEVQSKEMLQQFINIFTDRGWLNHSVCIKYGDSSYRILCNETEFIVYRINDNKKMSQGMPGWPVCYIAQDKIIENSEMSSWASTEPSARQWMNYLSKSDFAAEKGLNNE